MISSAGSTQNAVLAAPPQPNSPPRDGAPCLATGSIDDREAEAEADAVEGRLGEQRPAELLEVDAAGQVVAGHVATVREPSRRHAVELAAAEQHLREAVVVRGGRDEPAATAEQVGRRSAAVAHGVERTPRRSPGAGRRARRGGRRRSGGTQKAVSVMPSGSKIRCARTRRATARRHLDDPAEHVGGDRVVPLACRAGTAAAASPTRRSRPRGRRRAGMPHSKPAAR